MPYNLRLVKKSIIAEWSGNDFFLLKYSPIRVGNDATFFILDFKENVDSAVEDAIEMLIPRFKDMEERLRDQFGCRYIVSIPPHAAGRSSVPCERVCAALAHQYGWLTHIPDALVRSENVRKAARSPTGQRPTTEDHVRTIYFGRRDLKIGNRGIIMVDDVYTTGSVSGACRAVIKSATGCPRVIGVFLGRTQ